jgi:O-succinylbenzoate synthase
MSATASFYRYRLPLVRPIELRTTVINERIGLLVRIATPSGHTGWGEIAPLPGYSPESLEEALVQACTIATVITRRDLDSADPRLTGLRRQESFYASVRFGLESALLNLHASRTGQPPAHLISDASCESVHVNALFTGTGKRVVDAAVAAVERGYVAIKLKVGRDSLTKEVKTVRELRAALPETVEIRLDANRAWPFEDAREFLAAIGSESVSYIEEPLTEPGRLPELRLATGAAYAVDESLQEVGWRVLASLRERGKDCLDHFPAFSHAHLIDAVLHASAWVVKPTLLGAPLEFYSATAPTNGYDGPIVISSSFESGLGLGMLANLAGAVNRGRIPAGLDTQSWFRGDALEEGIVNVDGTCDLARVWQLASRPVMTVLEEIAHV